MFYDYAIVGAGVSGAVCAFQLAKKGKKCIVFEKNKEMTEKVCGGGISYKAIMDLESIGIRTEPLFIENSKTINGHITRIADGTVNVKKYGAKKRSIGIQRSIFDSYLIKIAIQEGATVCYEHPVNDVIEIDGGYSISNYCAKKIIWAIGARTFDGKMIDGQSIGYSGQIVAESSLESDYFHYWYYDIWSRDKYFWAFPIGENLWNVGLWSRQPFQDIKNEYDECLMKLFIASVKGKWHYYRNPRAELLGHIDQRKERGVFEYGIGDFAGLCNPVNGGGIIQAIESAMKVEI